VRLAETSLPPFALGAARCTLSLAAAALYIRGHLHVCRCTRPAAVPLPYALKHRVVETKTAALRHLCTGVFGASAWKFLGRNAARKSRVARPPLEQVNDNISAETSHAAFSVLLQHRKGNTCVSSMMFKERAGVQAWCVREAMDVRKSCCCSSSWSATGLAGVGLTPRPTYMHEDVELCAACKTSRT
jgi:hypothetical protein